MIIRNVEKKETKTKGSRSEGKMNIVREGKKISHTITNIPEEGVYMGVCEDNII
jgi:predicted peroxiredoxin